MPPKADKLQENIDALKTFLHKKVARHSELEGMIGELKKIEAILAEKKLTMQIVSQYEIFNQAVFDLINSNPEFVATYHIKFDTIPTHPLQLQPQIITNLILERLIADSPEIEKEYELNINHKYLIGRSPDCDIILDKSLYRGVSWQHAQLAIIANSSGEIQWEIKDLNSSNGTYINGEKLENNYIIQTNDKITLGNKKLEKNIAQLRLNRQILEADNEINEPYFDLINCDLLLLIIDGTKEISEQEKWLLKELDSTYISKQILVVDIPNEVEKKDIDINKLLENIDTLLKQEATISMFEILPLYLKPYYDEETSKELPKPIQKRQDKFIKEIGNLIKRQPENVLAKRLAIHIAKILEPVEGILAQDQVEIKTKISEYKDELSELTKVNWKDVTKQAINNVKEDKDKFFKQIKLDLAQAKASILDNFSKRSIIYKVQDFVDQLQAVVFLKQGQSFLKLCSENNEEIDVNKILVDFCISSIEEWAIKEWDKVNNIYDNGGLNGLLNRAYQTVNIIPSLFEKSPFSSPEEIDIKSNFMISFAGIECEQRHKQVSLGVYIMKQIRSNMMQIMMMLTMVLALIGIKAGKNQIFAQISQLFKSFPWLLGLAIFSLVFFLVNAYNQDNNLKLEEGGDKLKKELSNYYQSLSKNLLDKVIQDINLALEYEGKRIDNTLENIQDTYQDYIVNVEKKQILMQTKMEQYKEREKNIATELAEFKKLKKV